MRSNAQMAVTYSHYPTSRMQLQSLNLRAPFKAPPSKARS